MPNFKSISFKVAVLQGGGQNLPSPCVCYPKDPMWNRVKELSLDILTQLPEYFETIYVQCNTYQENSIKDIERGIRGESDRMVIQSSEMHTPADFKTFLNNGERF